MSAMTVVPYRYVKNGVAVHIPNQGAWKVAAHRLAEACGLRYVNRARAWVGTTTQADRVQRLHAAGWDAHLMLFKDQDWAGDGAQLPEPWMRRRARIWIAPADPR